MTRVLILLASLVFVGPANAKETYGGLTVTNFVRVYDGDTFYVDVEGLHSIIGKEMPIRIRGVDTPEIKHRAKCDEERELGEKARLFVEERLQSATKIELIDIERGSFFRIVAEVIYDGKSIAPEIIEAGLGVVYHSKKKKDWCAEAQTD